MQKPNIRSAKHERMMKAGKQWESEAEGRKFEHVYGEMYSWSEFNVSMSNPEKTMPPHGTDDWIHEYERMGYSPEEAGLVFLDTYLANGWENPPEGNADYFDFQKRLLRDLRIDQLAERGFFDVATAFEGVTQIEEYEDALIYIPSGADCSRKCLEKYFGQKFDLQLNPLKASLRAIKAEIMKHKPWDECPRFVRNAGGRWERTDSHHQTKATAVIALLAIDKVKHHAILIKTTRYNDVTSEYIRSKIKVSKNPTLSDDQYKLQRFRQLPYAKFCYVYDLETPSRFNERGDRELFPFGAGLQRIDLEEGKPAQDAIRTYIGTDCIEKMLECIRLEMTAKGDKTATVYAHNGGCFDHIFLKRTNALRFTSQLKSGRIKQLKAVFTASPDIELVFLDSFSFTQLSLKQSAEAFKTARKQEFDIVDKDQKFYEETKEWIEYMRQDVLVLGQIVFALACLLKKFGECVTTSTGIASIAWRLIRKACHHMDHVYTPKCLITKTFIRQACYGGRVLHWKKTTEAGVPYICLDGNSLYPSAMALGVYPTKKYKIIPAEGLTVEAYTATLEKGILSIAEVVLDGHNIRYPLIPHRTDDNVLVYPSNVFQGVYTSVELVDALRLGYSIKKVVRGIQWSSGKKIFARLLTNLYRDRAKLKKENNPAEHLMKILYNSMYGKMLELIKTRTAFSDRNDAIPNKIAQRRTVISASNLPNGQVEQSIKLEFSQSRKPTYLGAFILSYARSIMNQLIIKVRPENIAYSDTDSIYVRKDVVESAQLKLSDGLGGFKNDYGDGLLITDAIFLDLKRYHLKFNNGNYKAKFNGISFRDKNCLKSWINRNPLEPKSKAEALEDLYKWFLANPQTLADLPIIQDKWSRATTGVKISEKELAFQVDPDKRANWQRSEDGKTEDFYPKDYNFIVAERKYPLGYRSASSLIGYKSTDDFTLWKKGLNSSLPLYAEGETTPRGLSKSKIPLNMVQGFSTSFVGMNDGRHFMLSDGKFYEFDKYGITKERDDIKEFDNFLIALPFVNGACVESTPSQVLNYDELKKLLSDVMALVGQYKKTPEEQKEA